LSRHADLVEVAQAVKYEHLPANRSVFFYGDHGDRFYLILKGECEVYVPLLLENLDHAHVFDSAQQPDTFKPNEPRKNSRKAIQSKIKKLKNKL